MSKTQYVSVKGKSKSMPAAQICNINILFKGRFLKKAEIFDEYWLEHDSLPPPEQLLSELKNLKDMPDIVTFGQRVPELDPKHSYYYEYENYAVLPIYTYEQWFNEQIPSSTRRNIRASEKKGVLTQVCEYDKHYIEGIVSIYNETPIRAGRKFWHYGKDFETVKKENGTYAERSTYIAAYFQGEIIGYLKIVWDRNTAAIMQILSKIAFRDYRTNNALLAEAVRQCCLRGVNYLLYEQFDYGKKTEDSLTKFKQNNGFKRMDVPRYFIPLTVKGSLALRLGFHKNLGEKLPEWIASPVRGLRTKWYERTVLRINPDC